MTWLVPVPVVLPLVGAALSVLFGRSRAVQRAIGVTVLAALVVVSVVLLVDVDRDGTLVAHGGGWAGPLGISLVADRFASLLLAVA